MALQCRRKGDIFSLMLSILSDTEKIVVETIRMRLSTKQALQYLKDNGLSVSRASYFRHKKKLEEKKLQRLYYIANIGFEDQHLERLDGLELIEKKMWEEYNKEKEPFKRVQILKDIAHIQPYLSTYYEATKYIIDNAIIDAKEKNVLEFNNITNNPRINDTSAISFNGETNNTPDKNEKETGIAKIDKLISQTTDPRVIAQLEKIKANAIFC